MYPVGTAPRPGARLPAASRVDKATSHLLQGPDWAVNLEICDIINADVWWVIPPPPLPRAPLSVPVRCCFSSCVRN